MYLKLMATSGEYTMLHVQEVPRANLGERLGHSGEAQMHAQLHCPRCTWQLAMSAIQALSAQLRIAIAFLKL